jgi:hypothetical protein
VRRPQTRRCAHGDAAAPLPSSIAHTVVPAPRAAQTQGARCCGEPGQADTACMREYMPQKVRSARFVALSPRGCPEARALLPRGRWRES